MTYGPSRGEHRMRLAVSLVGLGLIGATLLVAPVEGLAWVEVVGVAGLFFGGSAAWSGWVLWTRR